MTIRAGVGAGSLLYAAAGLLAGRPANTYWGAPEELRALDATVAIREHDRFPDDGAVMTSAGVSAEIDVAATSWTA